MTASVAPSGSGTGSRRGGWFVLLLAGAVLLVAVLGGRPPEEGTALSPNGVGPSGAKALRELLEAFGAEVDVDDDLAQDADVAVLLLDDLTEEQRADLVAWVEDGGRLVITDPFSELTPLVAPPTLTDPFGADPDEVRLPETCTIGALAELEAIEPGAASDYEVREPDEQCFGPDGMAYVVASPRGEGTVIALGSSSVFENARLDRADNAVLAVDLIAPEAGTRVAWLERDRQAPAARGDLWSLVGPGTRAALLQLAIAALVYVIVRARRLGRPVREPRAVDLAGSELVVAVGHLMQQGRNPDRAARLLRSDLRRVLRERLGLPAETSPDLLARVVSARSGISREQALAVLTDQPVGSEQALVALARQVEQMKQEVLHGVTAEPRATEPRATEPTG